MLHGNRLLLSYEAPKGKLHSLIVKSNWLGLVFKGQQNAADPNLGRIMGYDRGATA